MVNSVQYSNYNNVGSANYVKSKAPFASNPQSKSKEAPISPKEGVAIGVGAASVAALLVTRAKLGKVLKSIGEDVPKTISGRIKALLDCSTIDAMTKLGNKKNLTTNVINDYNIAMKNGDKFGIAMFDMDNFKGINEEFGHDVGDTFLKRISSNIKEVAEKHGGKAYRYGGEEFVVTKTGKDIDMKAISEEIAENIRKDSTIQEYLPKFQEKAKGEIKNLSSKLDEINSIFDSFRAGKKVETQRVIDAFNDYIKEYDKHNSKGMDAVIKQLQAQDKKHVTKSMLSMPITKTSNLSDELSNISSQYKYQRSDLSKWSHHLDVHNNFTVSGGYGCLSSEKALKPENSIQLVNIADNALQASKLNGKNLRSEATANMIDLALKK